MRPVIGILPAAGLDSRLHPFAYPKELLPIGYRWSAEHQEVAPSLVIEHSLDAMAFAGITRCLLIVSPILRVDAVAGPTTFFNSVAIRWHHADAVARGEAWASPAC